VSHVSRPQARVYLLSAGFSLAFGSMFTKTYRVHRIFTRSRSGVVKNKVGRENNNSSLAYISDQRRNQYLYRNKEEKEREREREREREKYG